MFWKKDKKRIALEILFMGENISNRYNHVRDLKIKNKLITFTWLENEIVLINTNNVKQIIMYMENSNGSD